MSPDIGLSQRHGILGSDVSGTLLLKRRIPEGHYSK